MKNFLWAAFLIALYSSGMYAQDCTSVISVKTGEQKAVILVNGKNAGHGSAELNVEKGKYIILVKNNPDAWNSPELTDSVVIDDCGQRKELSFHFDSLVYLKSSPADAYVYYKDSLMGHTPLFIPVNIDRVELRKENHRSKEVFPEQLLGNNTVNLDFTGPRQGSSFLKSNTFRILTGTALVLGATAAYFKIKADNTFDEYMLNRDQALLDRTDKYDLISGIALGALQVNFGVLIYYFLTD